MTDCFHLPTATRILDIQQDNYRTKTFVLDARLKASPGQFVMTWLPRFDEKPFSLVNADPVTLMITSVGPFTQLIHQKQIGDSLWIRGAFGNGFKVETSHRRLALVGGGYGVAPLLWLAQQQSESAESITVIIGARSAQDILYDKRFADLEQTLSKAVELSKTDSPLSIRIATEDGSLGQQGRVTDILAPLVANGEVDSIYACGPHGMLAALDQLGQRHNLACQLSWEAYMRCAVGICGSCEHHGKLLCLDGPVL